MSRYTVENDVGQRVTFDWNDPNPPTDNDYEEVFKAAQQFKPAPKPEQPLSPYQTPSPTQPVPENYQDPFKNPQATVAASQGVKTPQAQPMPQPLASTPAEATGTQIPSAIQLTPPPATQPLPEYAPANVLTKTKPYGVPEETLPAQKPIRNEGPWTLSDDNSLAKYAGKQFINSWIEGGKSIAEIPRLIPEGSKAIWGVADVATGGKVKLFKDQAEVAKQLSEQWKDEDEKTFPKIQYSNKEIKAIEKGGFAAGAVVQTTGLLAFISQLVATKGMSGEVQVEKLGNAIKSFYSKYGGDELQKVAPLIENTSLPITKKVLGNAVGAGEVSAATTEGTPEEKAKAGLSTAGLVATGGAASIGLAPAIKYFSPNMQRVLQAGAQAGVMAGQSIAQGDKPSDILLNAGFGLYFGGKEPTYGSAREAYDVLKQKLGDKKVTPDLAPKGNEDYVAWTSRVPTRILYDEAKVKFQNTLKNVDWEKAAPEENELYPDYQERLDKTLNEAAKPKKQPTPPEIVPPEGINGVKGVKDAERAGTKAEEESQGQGLVEGENGSLRVRDDAAGNELETGAAAGSEQKTGLTTDDKLLDKAIEKVVIPGKSEEQILQELRPFTNDISTFELNDKIIPIVRAKIKEVQGGKEKTPLSLPGTEPGAAKEGPAEQRPGGGKEGTEGSGESGPLSEDESKRIQNKINQIAKSGGQRNYALDKKFMDEHKDLFDKEHPQNQKWERAVEGYKAYHKIKSGPEYDNLRRQFTPDEFNNQLSILAGIKSGKLDDKIYTMLNDIAEKKNTSKGLNEPDVQHDDIREMIQDTPMSVDQAKYKHDISKAALREYATELRKGETGEAEGEKALNNYVKNSKVDSGTKNLHEDLKKVVTSVPEKTIARATGLDLPLAQKAIVDIKNGRKGGKAALKVREMFAPDLHYGRSPEEMIAGLTETDRHRKLESKRKIPKAFTLLHETPDKAIYGMRDDKGRLFAQIYSGDKLEPDHYGQFKNTETLYGMAGLGEQPKFQRQESGIDYGKEAAMSKDEHKKYLENLNRKSIDKWNKEGSKGFPPSLGRNTIKERTVLAEKAGYVLPRDADKVVNKPLKELIDEAYPKNKETSQLDIFGGEKPISQIESEEKQRLIKKEIERRLEEKKGGQADLTGLPMFENQDFEGSQQTLQFSKKDVKTLGMKYEDFDKLTPEEKKEAFEKIQKENISNPVTGVPGQKAFNIEFEKVTEGNTKDALFAFGDINGVKEYNDKLLGMDGTNKLFKVAYDYIEKNIPGVKVFHLHGDEYAISANDMPKDELREKLSKAMTEFAKDATIEKDGITYKPTMSWNIGHAKTEKEGGELNPKNVGKNEIGVEKDSNKEYNITKGAKGVSEEHIVRRDIHEKRIRQRDMGKKPSRTEESGQRDLEGEKAGDTSDKRQTSSPVNDGGKDEPGRNENLPSRQNETTKRLSRRLGKVFNLKIADDDVVSIPQSKEEEESLSFFSKLLKVKVEKIDTSQRIKNIVRFNGLMDHGTVFYHADSKNPVFVVTSHEVSHIIQERYKNTHYKKLIEFQRQNLTEKGWDEVRRRDKRGDIGEDELAADTIADCMNDRSWWADLYDYAPETAKKLLDMMETMFDKIVYYLKGHKLTKNEWFKDVEAQRRAITEAVAKVLEAEGKKRGDEIFKEDFGGDSPMKFLMKVFHGSPHKFDKFDANKIGTGEGNQIQRQEEEPKIDLKLGGFDSKEEFEKAYEEKSLKEHGETKDEFIQRSHCQDLVPTGKRKYSIKEDI